jgi:FAD/FMN-containing dehydrogenase
MSNTRQDLEKILGKTKVFDDPEILDSYSKDHSFAPQRKPICLVTPKNADEVQALVKWANRSSTSLVPVSSGAPHFYGDTVPTAAGAVIVDLHRMKRIIRIDRRNRMALVEPGVTYAELQPALAGKGLRLSTPLLPRANKSVIGSLLERQPVMVPKYQWVLLEPLRCLEVIWGNGDRLVTGEAGEYGSLEEQWERGFAQVNPMGPGQIDYWRLVAAAQGSMGIATWASVRCEVLPTLHHFFFIPAEKLDGLIDCAYKLLRVRVGDEFMILDNSVLAGILGKDAGQIKTLKKELPTWVIVIGVAGRDRLPKERCEFQIKDVTGIVKQSGLDLVSSITGVTGEQIMEIVLNPSEDPYWKLRYKGGFKDIFFLTTLNRVPEFIDTMHSTAEGLNYPAEDIGIYVQPQHQGVCCHCEFSLPYNPNDQKDTARVEELFIKASDALIAHGAFFSRPYGIWAEMVYKRDAEQATLLRKVKEIFDPNNVLNPGKLCF